MKNILVCLLLLLAARAIEAQETATQPIQIGSVTFSGSVRERYEVWNWFEPASGNNLYGYSGTVVRFGFSQKHESYDWNIEFEAPILLGIPNHAVNPAPLGQYGLGGSYYAANKNSQYAAFLFPKQAFLRIKGKHESLRMGRMEFTDGSEVTPKDTTLASLKAGRISQRLIGNFGFSDVMRSLDGLQFLYGNGPWTFTAVSAIPTRGVFPSGRVGMGEDARHLCGTHAPDGNGKSRAEWRIFGIYYNDDRPLVKTDNRPAAFEPPISVASTSAHTGDTSSWLRLQPRERLICSAGARSRAAVGENWPSGLVRERSN